MNDHTLHLLLYPRLSVLESLIRSDAGDAVVLIAEGVNLLRDALAHALIAELLIRDRLYVLTEEPHLHNADEGNPVGFKITYDDLVELTARYPRCMTWS